MKKTISMLLMAITLAAIIIPVLTGCTSVGGINLNKYVNICADGYETKGKLHYEFDKEAFIADYGDKISIKKESKQMVALMYGSNANPAAILAETCIRLSAEGDTYNLKNGDVVKIKWICNDEDVDTVFGCKLRYSDIEYTVEGLKSVKAFNPFDYVTVTFKGASPYGTADVNVNYDIPEMQYIKISIDRYNNLKNGDTVELSSSTRYTYGIDFTEKFGEVLSDATVKIKVNGLAEYAKTANQIPEDTYKKMNNQLVDAFKAHVANKWTSVNKNSVSEIKNVGAYFLTLKEGASRDFINRVYMIYKITANLRNRDDDVETVPFTYYWWGCFDDIVINDDGTCGIDLAVYNVSESWASLFSSGGDYLATGLGSKYVSGFLTLEDFEMSHIIPKIEYYTYVYTEM